MAQVRARLTFTSSDGRVYREGATYDVPMRVALDLVAKGQAEWGRGLNSIPKKPQEDARPEPPDSPQPPRGQTRKRRGKRDQQKPPAAEAPREQGQ